MVYTTQFWNEVSIGDTQLRVLFSSPAFMLWGLIKIVRWLINCNSRLPLSLRRSVRGGVESSQLALLQTYIEGTLLSNMEDRWVCDLNGEGVFWVKDVRILLDECFLPKAPTATRWVKYIGYGYSSGSYAAGEIYHGRPLVHMLIGLIGSIPSD
ncbi:hypothetical protein Tco_0385423 [Tanacetum coccineum]